MAQVAAATAASAAAAELAEAAEAAEAARAAAEVWTQSRRRRCRALRTSSMLCLRTGGGGNEVERLGS